VSLSKSSAQTTCKGVLQGWVTSVLQGCYKDVKGVLQACYKRATSEPQACCKRVIIVLQACYKRVTSVQRYRIRFGGEVHAELLPHSKSTGDKAFAVAFTHFRRHHHWAGGG
jgi:hypothetical protein